MKTMILIAVAAVSLSGCAGFGGYGSGVSVGVSSGYGYNNYGNYSNYGSDGYGYGQYGYDKNCVRYDRYGRPYYTCNSYYDENGYGGPRVAYYYPGYTYRQGYYYDRSNRRFEGRRLYRQHYSNHQHRRYGRRR